MKKFLSILLTAIVLFGVTGCFGKKTSDPREEKLEIKGNVKINYLILVNGDNKLPDTYEDMLKSQLEEATNAWGDTIKVEKETLKKYNELKEAMAKEGVEILLDSGYRSVKEQQEVWDDFEKKYGIEYTKNTVAVPWYSEHHTGLAIDIVIKKDGVLIEENEDMIAEREIFAKIHEKLADYGFILRYPEGKKDITGYNYEPWHFRYVGSASKAKEIKDSGLTFDEYMSEKE